MKRWMERLALVVVGVLILVWTVVPLYHMVVVSLTPTPEVFTGQLWPQNPTLENYRTVLTQKHFFLKLFWAQIGNSLFVALVSSVLVVAIGATVSYAIGRLRVRWGSAISNAALFTYVIPASFLAIPFYQIIANYGLLNNLWSLIFAMVTFASPYALWVMRQYAESIPMELDEAAKVDGASPMRVFVTIYLPLMTPAIAAIGTYALLLAWNEYLYAFLLLSSENRITLPVAMGHFLVTDDAPWNLLMATALLYAIPPAVLYYLTRRYMVTGLTAGGVKG
jgi:multiple sugar transport system permease protein